MPAYIKKDEEHDVLGNPLHPEEADIPDRIINKCMVTLAGRRYIWSPDKVQLQCAKCLMIMQILARPDIGNSKQRKFYTIIDCRCTRETI